MNHDGSTFSCGCAATADALFCSKELDKLVKQEQENCSFFVLFNANWFKYSFAGGWSAIAMATIKPKGKDRTVVAVSPGGAYYEVEPQSKKEVNGIIKTATGSLRSLTAIDDLIFACGMGRSVLQRAGVGIWNEVGPGTKKKEEDMVLGFEDLAAFSVDDLYAVGWMGEIWHRKKSKWKRLDSPVSANLNAVSCASDGKVYIVGDNETMLCGRDSEWEILHADGFGNLLDVAFYNDTVYVVTDFRILKLEGDTLVVEDQFEEEDGVPSSCLHLLTAPDGLFSLGTKDLFRTKGGLWERLV